MDWNITLSTPKTQLSTQPATTTRGHHLYQYTVYTGLGLVGGATGTALAIGLAIIIQALLAADTVFWPNLVLLAFAAILLGWVAAWLLGKIAQWMVPSFARREAGQYSLHFSLVASALLSVIQTYLFMAVL
jgi:hypothetical protein